MPTKTWYETNRERSIAYSKAWQAKNRERMQATAARRIAERRQWLNEQKAHPCMDCGHSFPPECMDFDHVRDKKEFAANMACSRSMEKLLVELAKCELVCANCHRIRTRRRREEAHV